MAAPVTVTRKATQLKAVQLNTHNDMHDALAYVSALAAGNYSGLVQSVNNGGTISWQLHIADATKNASAFATIGDYVVIENNALVSVCKAADFGSIYQ